MTVKTLKFRILVLKFVSKIMKLTFLVLKFCSKTNKIYWVNAQIYKYKSWKWPKFDIRNNV